MIIRPHSNVPHSNVPQSKRASAGFSLLEVLIAVVLLATGLLALAALQGSLARNSADAKARGRIASMLSAQMDELRNTPYASIEAYMASAPGAVNTDTDCGTPADTFAELACEAAADAGVGGLEVTPTFTEYGSNVGDTEFEEGTAAGSTDARFINAVVEATWTDAAGQAHTQSMRTVLSELALEPNSPLVDEEAENHTPQRAVVRQSLANTVTAGMIPIAMGSGQATAASNPTPELVGKNNNQQLVGTKFNVLTYTPQNSLAVIQQRIETQVVKCTCQYGAGGSNLGEIWRQSQWPAVWTGSAYDVYVPDNGQQAPGQTYVSGPKPGVTQSPLCQECCRDRHDDPADTTNAKFDPENTSTYQKYMYDNAGALITASVPEQSDYIEACRLIRVDGFWRVAADMYSRQFGLLETQAVGGVAAKSGLPTTTATTNYTSFVKDYLKQYDGSTAAAPVGAQAMYDSTTYGLNAPALVTISTPSTTDYRYMHARGLYVDSLEKQAREALAKALQSRRDKGQCQAGSSSLPDCVLPFLPFTTINVTEIADWTATNENVLSVNTRNLLSLNPSQPSGGRAYGAQSGSSDNRAAMRLSNSGVAVSDAIPAEVDLQGDVTESVDTQPFAVGGSTGGGTGDEFTVAISGGGSNPFAFYVLGADTGECVKPKNGNRRCTTNSTLPMSLGQVRVSNYWMKEDIDTPKSTAMGSVQCLYNGSPVTLNDTDIPVPSFRNYAVTAASVDGVNALSIGAPDPQDAKDDETTTITFATIPKNGVVSIVFTEQTGSPVQATMLTCTASKQGNGQNARYYFESATWTYPWE